MSDPAPVPSPLHPYGASGPDMEREAEAFAQSRELPAGDEKAREAIREIMKMAFKTGWVVATMRIAKHL